MKDLATLNQITSLLLSNHHQTRLHAAHSAFRLQQGLLDLHNFICWNSITDLTHQWEQMEKICAVKL